jgi:chloramphenicol 3-O-phosphotransferase
VPKIAFPVVFFIAACCAAFSQPQSADKKAANDQPWNFAVSGDSRNCGDVVMPSIAAGAIKNRAALYWHLGDLRAIYGPDEDYLHAPEHRGKVVEKDAYLKDAWDDFIQNQLAPFGSMPVFVGIGNHETIPPKTREQFIDKFSKWLDAPPLRKQRLADNPQDSAPKTYFHWIQGGVDFVYLDNATLDQFSPEQVTWLEGVVTRASSNPEVRTLVVGMHAALPDSVAHSHSMNDWQVGVDSGRRVYNDLANFNRQTHKNVYLLASHSHFYMSGVFNSDYRQAHGGGLPGWIIGTAGAVRYALPPDAPRATEARTKVYGFMMATVHSDGSIDFKFEEIKRPDTPAAVSQRYTPEFVDFCFAKNTAFSEPATSSHQ